MLFEPTTGFLDGLDYKSSKNPLYAKVNTAISMLFEPTTGFLDGLDYKSSKNPLYASAF